MLTKTLREIFTRDLMKMKAEIELYENADNIWKIDKKVTNSGGNLCLHIVGNLNAYIGAEIGKSGYVRDRDLEFSLKDVERNELIQKIDDTILMVHTVLAKLTEEDLKKDFPLDVLGRKTTVEFFLVHLVAHLGYHLGQINYHRRLLDN